jgi:ATP-binding cassette subfamily A (ABC1) protein 1
MSVYVARLSQVSGADYSVNAKNGASISAPIAFSLGLAQMLLYQSNFTPINGSNLNEIYQNYSMGACIGLLIFDIFFYLLLAWYADNVIPQEYGTTLPWYFPFTKSYWLSFCDIYEGAEADPLLDGDDV